MDAWWPLWVQGAVRARARRRRRSTTLTETVAIDNPPNNHGDHLGSAYQGSWYGYVSKDLRSDARRPRARAVLARVLRRGSLTRCRDGAAAVAGGGAEGAGERGLRRRRGLREGASATQWCFDAVRQRPTGGATQPLIHWINRPTYQQADEIPRAPARADRLALQRGATWPGSTPPPRRSSRATTSATRRTPRACWRSSSSRARGWRSASRRAPASSRSSCTPRPPSSTPRSRGCRSRAA